MKLKIEDLFERGIVFNLIINEVRELNKKFSLGLDEQEIESGIILDIFEIDENENDDTDAITISYYDIEETLEDEEKRLEFFDFLVNYYNKSTLKNYFNDKIYFEGAKPLVIAFPYIFEYDFNYNRAFELENIDSFDVYKIDEDKYIISDKYLDDNELYENAVEQSIKEDLENDLYLFNKDLLESFIENCQYDYNNAYNIKEHIKEILLDKKDYKDENYGNEMIETAIDLGFIEDDRPDVSDFENEEEYKEAFEEWVDEKTDYLETNIDELAEKYFEYYYGNVLEYYYSIFGDKAYENLINDGLVNIDCLTKAFMEYIKTSEGFYEYYYNRFYDGEFPKLEEEVELDGERYFIYNIKNLI